MAMTCFGFDGDSVGYYCIGAVSQEFSDNEYAAHGVGYWALSAAQMAERDARLGGDAEEEVAEETVEGEYDD